MTRHALPAWLVAVGAMVLLPSALAHAGPGEHAFDLLPLWAAQAVYALAWAGYLLGARRARPPRWRQLLMHGTMGLAGAVLFGPLDGLAAGSTAMHMVQHMALMVLVAPLLVLAGPLTAWRALPARRLDRLWRNLIRTTRRPMLCASIHATAIWIWHAPGPYLAAVQHNGWHVLEHACFLGSAWLFWWSVLRAGRAGMLHALMALLFTLMHTGLLGALLTFAPQPLYGRESGSLADQQLAGLLMWVPGGFAYLLGVAGVLGRALQRARPAGASLADERS